MTLSQTTSFPVTQVCCAGSSLSVLPGQRGDLPPLLHTEATRPIAATEGRKAFVGDAGRPRHKLGTQVRVWGGVKAEWVSGGGRFQRLAAAHSPAGGAASAHC